MGETFSNITVSVECDCQAHSVIQICYSDLFVILKFIKAYGLDLFKPYRGWLWALVKQLYDITITYWRDNKQLCLSSYDRVATDRENRE